MFCFRAEFSRAPAGKSAKSGGGGVGKPAKLRQNVAKSTDNARTVLSTVADTDPNPDP
jgi:hypothetical protein